VNGWARDYSLQMKQALDLAEDLEHEVIATISYCAKISDYKTKQILECNNRVKVCGSTNVSAIRYLLKDKDPFFSVQATAAEGNQEQIILSIDQCRIIGYQWLNVLNKIEAICAAWDSEAADSEVMETLFEPLITSKWWTLNKLTTYPDNKLNSDSDNSSTMIRKFLERYKHKQHIEQQPSLWGEQQPNSLRPKDAASIGAAGQASVP
jgi:hypothetical protein